MEKLNQNLTERSKKEYLYSSPFLKVNNLQNLILKENEIHNIETRLINKGYSVDEI